MREPQSVKVIRCRDGSYAVMQDGEITYGGSLSYEAAWRIADQLKAGVYGPVPVSEMVTDTEPPELVEYEEADDEDVFAGLGYRR